VADSFDISLAGFVLAMPTLPGRRKGASTQRLYLYHVQRLAAWSRSQDLQGFGALTKHHLRAYLAQLTSRSGSQASPAYESSVLDAIKCLFLYLEEDEDIPDIARKLSVGRPLESDRIAHLDRSQVDRLLGAASTSGTWRSSRYCWTRRRGLLHKPTSISLIYQIRRKNCGRTASVTIS